MRHTGWVCAGLTVATGLYCFSGAGSLLGAGVPVSASRATVAEDADLKPSAELETMQAEEHDRVERALFEENLDVPEKSFIQRVTNVWPLQRAVNPIPAKSPLSRLRSWAGGRPRDPFAEADDDAAPKVVTETDRSEPPIVGESGFTKSSSRRRLQSFQNGQTAAKVDAAVPDVAETAKPGARVVSKTESADATETPLEPSTSTAGANSPTLEPDTEAQLRSLFEDQPTVTQTPTVKRTASRRPAVSNEAGQPAAPTKLSSAATENEIRQVSEADDDENSTAASVEQAIPLPSEALKYRVQKSTRRPRSTANQALKSANEVKSALPQATVPSESAAESEIPTLTEPQDSPDEENPFSKSESETKSVTEQPTDLPKPDADLTGKSRVDQHSVESDAVENSESAVSVEPDSDVEPAARQETAAQPAAIIEPTIQPAVKSDLPPVQVRANRGIELPAPEGWSAAVKLNARRAARYAELLGRQPEQGVWPQITPAKVTRNPAPPVAKSPAFTTEQQTYRVALDKQPVTLDKIEDDGAVRVLTAERDVLETGHQAHPIDTVETATSESAAESLHAPVLEPAKIPDVVPEPIVVPEYAAKDQSVWWLRLITAASVLFGLYGMWCCRIRAVDGE